MILREFHHFKVVVADSTPLIHLGNTNNLYILKELFGQIYIPVAVFTEVTAKRDLAAQELVQNKDWVNVCIVQKPIEIQFENQIDLGESEAIALAISENADMIIIDDNIARQEALRNNLNCVGTARILIQAKNNGIIKEIKPIIDAMRLNGWYLDDRTYKGLLEIVEED